MMKHFFKISLASLLIVNGISLFGYGFFSLRPHNLALHPSFPGIFASSYQLFAQLQIALAFVAVAFLLTSYVQRLWISALISACLISFSMEYLGTTVGIPFGHYDYTSLLGYKLAGHVPFWIPLSWFTMAIASYGLIAHFFGNWSLISRILLSATVLTAWDITLDPAMSYLTPFWTWDNPGFFYGMPMLNLFGWMVTGVLIMMGFAYLKVDQWIKTVPVRDYGLVYAINLALPLGMVILAGLWLAFFVSAGVLIALVALYRLSPRPAAVVQSQSTLAPNHSR